MQALTAHVQSADAKAAEAKAQQEQALAAAASAPKAKTKKATTHDRMGDVDLDASSLDSDDGGMPTLAVKRESEVVRDARRV